MSYFSKFIIFNIFLFSLVFPKDPKIQIFPIQKNRSFALDGCLTFVSREESIIAGVKASGDPNHGLLGQGVNYKSSRFWKKGDPIGQPLKDIAYDSELKNHYLHIDDEILRIDNCDPNDFGKIRIGERFNRGFGNSITKTMFAVIHHPVDQLGKIHRLKVLRKGKEIEIDVAEFVKTHSKYNSDDSYFFSELKEWSRKPEGQYFFFQGEYLETSSKVLLERAEKNILYSESLLLDSFPDENTLRELAIHTQKTSVILNFWYYNKKYFLTNEIEHKLEYSDFTKRFRGKMDLIEHFHPDGNIFPTLEDLIEFDHFVYENSSSKKLAIRVPSQKKQELDTTDGFVYSYTLDEMQGMYKKGLLKKVNPNSKYIPKARWKDFILFKLGLF